MVTDVLEPAQIEELFADGVDLSNVATVLSLACLAVERLRNASTDDLDDIEFRYIAQGVEALRSQADAAAVDAARQLEERDHERHHGFFTSSAWMRHHLQLPKDEARVRLQVVRMLDALPASERAARHGRIGLEQLRMAARAFALEAVRDAFIEQADDLLHDAEHCDAERFAELLANLRRLADAERQRRAAQRRHDERRLSLRRRPDGSWRLVATFGDVQGAEINDVLAQFTDAEFRTDWADATSAAADGQVIGVDSLRRTQPQRRADALHQIALAAAAHPGEGIAPLPMLNVLIDEVTLQTEVEGGAHDPGRYREMVCRTQDGEPLPISEASSMALWAHIRRLVRDAAGTAVDLGRRRRLFTGSARDAVLLTQSTCLWFGCDAPVHRCEVDHTVEWGRRSGTTSPDNGGGMCKAHNLFKERRRYLVHRNGDGTWTITDRDGHPID
ncbi:MAG: hypothetical protein AAGG08_12180 [Actinomycetota bacterium]